MTRLLITRRLPDSVMAAARDRYDVTLREAPGPLTAEEARAALADYDALLPTIGDALGADAFGGSPRARIMANFGVGVNHIDVAAARAAGLTVTNTPGAVTDATADIAMTLILMTCRRAGEGERMLRAGRWEGWHPVQLLGRDLGRLTVGIVGMGRIGKAVARRCHYGFGMEVRFYNRSRVPHPGVPAHQIDTLEVMVREADIVVLAVPATPETRHMIDARVLAGMKDDAILINIARGDVVDEAALVAALQEGTIGGAGLDVYEREPEVPQALIGMENVTLLPHLGTAALSVREAMGRMALDNLAAFFDGREVLNPV
ncbi:D-glycerate dehydrogenase [Rhodobacteraceae bacterium CCMM004]|nr:D-glycerate dehydrogenase [Rhodobacteraceae bacterium CCMM004]